MKEDPLVNMFKFKQGIFISNVKVKIWQIAIIQISILNQLTSSRKQEDISQYPDNIAVVTFKKSSDTISAGCPIVLK